MIAVVQRVQYVKLRVEGQLVSEIGPGLLILLGISVDDGEQQADWLARKISQLRILADEQDKMNRSVLDTGQDVLVVSQFTLLADAAQGNRPSYIKAARPEQAIPLYERVVSSLQTILGKEIPTGVFGADMKIEMINDGPVTIYLDTSELMK
jgi:D-tyrosyl-tRNA(Tyr) deacylase